MKHRGAPEATDLPANNNEKDIVRIHYQGNVALFSGMFSLFLFDFFCQSNIVDG